MQPRPHGRGSNGGEGFSLIEVLVATGILAVALSGLAPIFLVAARANVDARHSTYAAVLAAQKIEELRAAPFPEPTGGELMEDLEPPYQRRWAIEALPGYPLDAVVISVAVSQRSVAQRTVRLVTIRSRKGTAR